MKKFIVDTGKKKYSVEANDAEHAVEIIKKITSDAKPLWLVNVGQDKPIQKVFASSEKKARAYFENKGMKVGGVSKSLNTPMSTSYIPVADEASQLQTVNALIEDEKAAVEAYNVAIENLRGKIPEDSLQAIIAIRDDENRHIENLQAVVNGTVTEKNLEDSMMNDEEFVISKNGVPLDGWYPNDLPTSRGSLRNIIRFSNNSYMTFSNEGEAKDMLSAIKRDILDLSKSYPSAKEKLLSLLNNLKVTKIKDATMMNDVAVNCNKFEILAKESGANFHNISNTKKDGVTYMKFVSSASEAEQERAVEWLRSTLEGQEGSGVLSWGMRGTSRGEMSVMIKDSMINDSISECYAALEKAKDVISTIYKNYAKEQDSVYMLEKLNEASSAIARAIRQYKAWM